MLRDESSSADVRGSPLNIESNGPHKLQSVAGLNDALTQAMIEPQLTVFEVILKMEVCGSGFQRSSNFSQGQVVSGQQAYRASFQ